MRVVLIYFAVSLMGCSPISDEEHDKIDGENTARYCLKVKSISRCGDVCESEQGGQREACLEYLEKVAAEQQ